MVSFNDKRYSGNVIQSEDEKLIVVIYTVDSFSDVLASTNNLSTIEETDVNGSVNSYHVTVPLSAKEVSHNVYSIEFSTKPTFNQEMQNRIEEQDEIINTLLALLLEGSE